MGIREQLNERKGMVATLAAVLLVTAVTLMWFGQDRAVAVQDFPERVYFTIDDGKSFFPDLYSKIPPFEHDGKRAYRAVVVRDGAGTDRVAYLETYPEESARLVREGEQAGADDMAKIKAMRARHGDVLVKRPGAPDSAWVPAAGPEGQAIVRAKLADGTRGTPVLP